jgi:hypothetical protein
MLQDVEVDAVEERPVLEIDPPAPTKPASLTGALVQRGRDRASHTPESAAEAPVPMMAAAPPEPISAPGFSEPVAEAPAEIAEAHEEPGLEASFGPEDQEVPLVFAPRDGAALERSPSRFSDALFVLACCGAFFATFLFALRF